MSDAEKTIAGRESAALVNVRRHEDKHIDAPVIPVGNALYAVLRAVLYFVSKLYFRLEVIGADNVPKSGGVLLAPNHASNIDPTTVACGLSRQVHFLAKEELFSGFLGWLLPRVNAHPLKKSGIDRTAIRMCREIVHQGHVLMLFPEGQRTVTGELLEPKPGAALIAAQARVPLVPVYISGSLHAMPTGASMIKPKKIRVFYGEPFYLEDIDVVRMPKKEFYEKAGILMMDKIRELESKARVLE